MAEYTFTDSITIDASPQRVYDVVSDVTRTGEWSPICRACEWEDGDGPHVGAHFTGYNVKADREWQTRNEVVVADPGRAFAWEVADGLIRWSYQLDTEGSGTRLSETWDFYEAGQEMFRQRYGDTAEQEMDIREADARAGIPASLAVIKRIAEG